MCCITLLSDFGLQDASVAATKGIVMQNNPGTSIVDITHDVEPFNLQQAAYLCAAAYRHFPKGTCHLLLFHVYYAKTSRLVICEKDGFYFIAPDNGILPLAFGEDYGQVWVYLEIETPFHFKDWVGAASLACRQLREKTPLALGLKKYQFQNAPQYFQPQQSSNSIECQVIHIDRFENVVINLKKAQFEEVGRGRPFRILFMRNEEITAISENYLDVREGEKLCRFNATGYLEICINKGKAASLFGFKLHKEKHLIYNTIKIYFE